MRVLAALARFTTLDCLFCLVKGWPGPFASALLHMHYPVSCCGPQGIRETGDGTVMTATPWPLESAQSLGLHVHASRRAIACSGALQAAPCHSFLVHVDVSEPQFWEVDAARAPGEQAVHRRRGGGACMPLVIFATFPTQPTRGAPRRAHGRVHVARRARAPECCVRGLAWRSLRACGHHCCRSSPHSGLMYWHDTGTRTRRRPVNCSCMSLATLHGDRQGTTQRVCPRSQLHDHRVPARGSCTWPTIPSEHPLLHNLGCRYTRDLHWQSCWRYTGSRRLRHLGEVLAMCGT